MLRIDDIKNLDIEIRKEGNVIYSGNSDNVPEDLKNIEYKSIGGAYPVVIEI